MPKHVIIPGNMRVSCAKAQLWAWRAKMGRPKYGEIVCAARVGMRVHGDIRAAYRVWPMK